MPLAIPIAMIAASAISAASSAAAARKKKFESTSKTTPEFSPEVQALLGQLSGVATNRIQDPSKELEPLRLRSRDSINRSYAGFPESLAQRMLAFGGGTDGKSGKFGRAMREGEMTRLGGLWDTDTEFAKLANQNRNEGLGLAERLLALGRGSSTEAQWTQPGNVAGAALGSAGQSLGGIAGYYAGQQQQNQTPNATMMYTLNQMLQRNPNAFQGSGYVANPMSTQIPASVYLPGGILAPR